MKLVRVTENGGCFAISLQAETLQDAALLTRLGMNATKDMRYVGTSAYEDGRFEFGIVIGKHKRATERVPSRGEK
jgi:hypothetical protein